MNTKTYTAIVTENFVLATVPFVTTKVTSDEGAYTQDENKVTIRIVVNEADEGKLVEWLFWNKEISEFAEDEAGLGEEDFS